MKYNKVIARLFFESQGLPAPETEFKFHPDRKWRFDFAFPEHKLALEVDGGIFISGGHNRGAQMLKTWEKENAAAAMGWRILRCQPKDLCLVETANLIRDCFKINAELRPDFITGTIVAAGTDPVNGMVRVIVETTVKDLRDLKPNLYGKKCRVEVLKMKKPNDPSSPTGGSALDVYNEGWRDGLTAAANIFDQWYRNNCTTAGATNAIELATRLFNESKITRNDPPNAPNSPTAERR